MDNMAQQQILLTGGLLSDVLFAAMATVNEDGSPHNTPLFFMHDEDLSHVYWGSRTDTTHSRNAERTGRVYFVMYDSVEYRRGGLYITGVEAHRLLGTELDEGLRVQNATRAKFGKSPIERSYYENNMQAMYRAKVDKIEIHVVNRDASGHIASEVHRSVSAYELMRSLNKTDRDSWLV